MKGPPKFSTLPRNFSLPGHGARPTLKEKDTTWSGTSTLGPKPKSRVQQIYDFRASEGTSSQSSRGTTIQGTGYVLAKPRDEVGAAARGVEEKTVGIQSRPNLLRASSMPITLQQRKGSDSSSPDRTLGTPENGSTENMFRASPDIVERRCLPQDRAGLHQQITVALKRVRELEEQVKTIPDLKSQICSLREEREQLLVQLQAQVQAQVSTSPSTISPNSDAGKHTQAPGHKPVERLNLALKTPTGGLDAPEDVEVTAKEKEGVTEKNRLLQKETDSSSAHGEKGGSSESERQTQQAGQSDKQNETESLLQHGVKKAPQDIAEQDLKAVKEAETINIQRGIATNGEKMDDQKIEKMLQEKLMILETKLTQATDKLEKTNVLLKEQIEENKVKEEKILQLSEGMRVEVCTTEPHDRPRRESIDTGTETEKIDFTNQETETELPGTVDQGTDTDRICIEVCVPRPRTGSIDQGTETKVDIHDQVTEMEGAAVSPPRPRANSMERGTVTERISTQDQTTETPVTERVNQVTETEEEAVTDHPQQRPRTSSADRGTETERVGTVDRVTETELAQRTDQQTETERRHENNPTRNVEAESQVRETVNSDREEDADTVVSESIEEKEANERIKKESKSVVMKVLSSVAAVENIVEQASVTNTVSQNEGRTSPTGENKKFMIAASAQSDSETKEITPVKNVITEFIETKQIAQETVEKTAEGKTVCAIIKETAVTDTVVIVSEDAAVKTVAPVRPQRGRKLSAEQAHPSTPQLQAAPVRPHRGSNETQAKKLQTKPQVQAQIQNESSLGQSTTQLSEPQVKHEAPSVSQAEDRTQSKRRPGDSSEKKSQSQPPAETQGPSLVSSEAQTRPKSIKATQKGSSVSQPPTRGIGETKSRPTRQMSSDVQSQSRRSSSESQPPQKDANETKSLRRGSSEIAQRRGSNEAQASPRDSGETQPPRRGSSESPTSPAALGQVVTRLTGLLGEQWAQLGSSSGTQQTVSQQESSATQKQVAGKRPEAVKGATAKPAGKAAPAETTGKPAGKPGPSKMSSIQSQLVSSLSVLSAFYSPGQKTAAASKQQEQGRRVVQLGTHGLYCINICSSVGAYIFVIDSLTSILAFNIHCPCLLHYLEQEGLQVQKIFATMA